MDRISAMQTFVNVAHEGSFARAAERLQLSPQLVSKYVSQLEDHLGVRLLNRTTRKVSLTEAGQSYFQRASQLLIDLDDMENELGSLQRSARGTLRISAPVSFGIQHAAALITDFQKAYPDVQVDLNLNDRKVDIIEEGFDVALRIGQLKTSSLIARRVAPVQLVICASPQYLAEYGEPTSVEQLQDHRYLKYSYQESDIVLHTADGQQVQPQLNASLCANNGGLLADAAIQGAGFVIQPTFIVGKAIQQGLLKPLLPDYQLAPLALYAVYAHRQLLSNKVRCFIDFIDGYYGEPPYWDQADA